MHIFSHIQMSPKSSRISGAFGVVLAVKGRAAACTGKGRETGERGKRVLPPLLLTAGNPWQSFASSLRAEEPELKIKPAQLSVSKTSRTGLGFRLLIPNFDKD